MSIHFKEIRTRFFFCIYFILINFFVLFYYSDVIYDIFSYPFKTQNVNNLVSTKVTSTFFVPFKLSIYLSFILSIPYAIFNLWAFISPGLYIYEKKELPKIIVFSIMLFFFGTVFSFLFICPVAINFFINCSPSNVEIMFTIDDYLYFTTSIMLGSGVAFQIPLLIKIITNMNIIKIEKIEENRKYVLIIALIISMLLTPPDVISQIMLAIPILILFEIGIIISKDKR